jgi:tetratricopeptide (TPR) repeat protein
MADENHDHTPQGYFHYGVQLYAEGYAQEALEAFQQTALLDGGMHWVVNYNIVLCYGSLGHRDLALEQLRWMLQNLNPPHAERYEWYHVYYLLMENQLSEFPTDIRRELEGL